MSWIPGLWMGLFWAGLGIFMLVSSWLGRASFYVPRLNFNLGWIIIALGLLRIWWWWKTEEQPTRKKRETQAELKQMKREIVEAQYQGTEKETDELTDSKRSES